METADGGHTVERESLREGGREGGRKGNREREGKNDGKGGGSAGSGSSSVEFFGRVEACVFVRCMGIGRQTERLVRRKRASRRASQDRIARRRN